MSKFDDAMNTYREQLGLLDGEFDDALLTQIAKNEHKKLSNERTVG